METDPVTSGLECADAAQAWSYMQSGGTQSIPE